MGFVDLHSHVLPALDDGAPDPDTSLAMLRGLAAAGFEVVCATPHQKSGHFLPSRDAIDAAHRELVGSVCEHNIAIDLRLAAENMWDDVFYERTASDTIPGYDGGTSFLLEFPLGTELPNALFDRIFEWRRRGHLPVIAHPERYKPLWGNPALVDRLRADCALCVDLGALAGYHGRQPGKLARKLVKDGIAHAVASDVHTVEDVRAAAEGIAWIRERVGSDAVTRLLDEHPRLILQGQHPEG